MSAIDWQALEELARLAMKQAYTPYSHFPVGAAALIHDGRMVSGCNVENASYGLTLCAECGLVSELIRTGGGKIVAFCCVDGSGNTLMPCGRCRQLLYEHAHPEMQIQTTKGICSINDLLPEAFGNDDLEAYIRT